MSNDETRSSLTVKEHFDACVAEYDAEVVKSSLSSTDPAFQQRVARLLLDLGRLWHRFEAAGACSINDEIDDLTTSTLSMLITPFIVADLHQRRLPTAGASPPAQGAGRAHALAVSLHYYDAFLKLMVQLGLVSERDAEVGVRFNPNDRTKKIENSRKLAELTKQVEDVDHRIAFTLARSKRMRQLCSDEGDSYEEHGGVEEELLRERAVLRLKWGVQEAFRQCQMSSRELEMLESLSDDQRRSVVNEYQQRLKDAESSGGAGVGRETYTILPGGQIVTGTLHQQRRLAGEVGCMVGGSASAPLCTTSATFREQVKNEVFMERNRPTMTLAEFAQMEMAEIDRQMRQQAENAQQAQEEEERLGPEGIEERQRQYDSRWSDWKDDNPPIGISTKGNYS